MKLSKKYQARQRAIAKALASGKALDGLLVGVAAATLVGCDRSPFRVMGAMPANSVDEIDGSMAVRGAIPAAAQPNAGNENAVEFVTMGEPPAVMLPEQPNKGNEKLVAVLTAGKPMPPRQDSETTNATNETETVWATAGDIAIEIQP